VCASWLCSSSQDSTCPWWLMHDHMSATADLPRFERAQGVVIICGLVWLVRLVIIIRLSLLNVLPPDSAGVHQELLPLPHAGHTPCRKGPQVVSWTA